MKGVRAYINLAMRIEWPLCGLIDYIYIILRILVIIV